MTMNKPISLTAQLRVTPENTVFVTSASTNEVTIASKRLGIVVESYFVALVRVSKPIDQQDIPRMTYVKVVDRSDYKEYKQQKRRETLIRSIEEWEGF